MAGLDKRIDIWGMYHDMISGPMAKSMASIRAMMGLTNKAAKSLAGISVLNNKAAFLGGIQKQTAAINAQASAYQRLAASAKTYSVAAARAAAAGAILAGRGAAAGSRVMFGPGSAGIGVPRLRFTPMQQGLAAMGGMGYALGRGGIQTLIPLAGLYGSYVASKRYANVDYQMRLLRRTANLSEIEGDNTLPALQELSRKYGPGQLDVISGATRLALGGVRGTSLIGATEELVRASKLWEGVDVDVMADSLSKMVRLFYKDKTGAEYKKGVAGWMRNFVEAVDFVEDNFPTRAADILKGFFRMQATGAFQGMAPEDAVAMLGVMMSQGEPSGERAGSRLRINIPRIKNSIIEGVNGKKKLNWKGIDRAAIRERFATGKQADYLIGVMMLAQNLEEKFKGLKPGERQSKIQQAIAAMTNPESAGNLMPLFADLDETMLQYALQSNEFAKWALETNEAWARRMENGTDFQKDMIRRIREAVKSGVPVWKGTSDRNIGIMMGSLKKQFEDIQNEWDQALTSWGKMFMKSGSKALENVRDVIKASRIYADKENSYIKRTQQIKDGKGVESLLFTPYTDKDGNRVDLGPASIANPYGPAGQAMGVKPKVGGAWVPPHMRGYYLGIGAVHQEKRGGYLMPDGTFLTYEQIYEKFRQPNGPLADYLRWREQDNRSGILTPPPPTRKPPPPAPSPDSWWWPFSIPGAQAAEAGGQSPLTSWPGNVPMGAPSIINQHMPGEPIVNQIPPPEVKVINNSAGLVNVTVSVSPAMQSIMRNPGTAAASGVQSDTGASKTGAVSR